MFISSLNFQLCGGAIMAKTPHAPDVASRIMERMVRMPPKPHKEMKLGKRKAKVGKSPKPKTEARAYELTSMNMQRKRKCCAGISRSIPQTRQVLHVSGAKSSAISRILKSLQSFLQKCPQLTMRLLLIRRRVPLILNGKREGKSACACLHVKAHHHGIAKCAIRRNVFSSNRRHHVSPLFVFASAERTSPSA
jgi:hypothetical protein